MSAYPLIQGLPVNFTIAQNGFIGIGTTQPTKRLHVQGDVLSSGTFTACNLVVTGDYIFLNAVTSNSDPFVIENASQNTPALVVSQLIADSSYSVAEFRTNSGIAMKVGGDGRVGIGTATPAATFDVNGSIRCATITGNASNVSGLAASAKIDTTNASNITTGTLPAACLPTQIFPVCVTGNVGIGTATAQASLDVRGTTSVSPVPVPPLPLNANSVVLANSPLTRYNGSYIVTSSFNANTAFTVFDSNPVTTWNTDVSYRPQFTPLYGNIITFVGTTPYYGHWVQIQVPSPTYMYSYTLTRGTNINNAPFIWYVMGSTNGLSWTLLHTVDNSGAGVPWDANTTSRAFYVGSQLGFTYFRFITNRIQYVNANITDFGTIAGWTIYGDTYPYNGINMLGKLQVGSIPDSISSPALFVDPATARIGIGTTVPQQALDVNGGTVRCGALAGGGGGTLVADANGVIGFNFSDASLKTDIAPLSRGLDDVLRLKPVTFRWKDRTRFGGTENFGLIAQEVAEVFPNIVDMNGDKARLDYVKLIPVLVKSIQDLSAKVAELQRGI